MAPPSTSNAVAAIQVFMECKVGETRHYMLRSPLNHVN